MVIDSKVNKFLIILFMLQSCAYAPITKEVQKKFTVCYTENNTDIESYIQVNGYYTMYNERWNNNLINMIFFKNGMVAWPVLKNSYRSDTCINFNKEFIFDKETNTFATSSWGMYRIQGDTLIVQSLNHAHLITPWSLDEEWYKIIDRNTLQLIYSKPLLKHASYAVKTIEEWQKENKYSLLKFHCADSLPNSDCWLKEQKWFWCNEQDWKQYMDGLKEKKEKSKQK